MEYRDFINTNMNDVITALNGSITPAPVNSELYRDFLNRKADDVITALNGSITPAPAGDELYRDFIERKFDDVITGIGGYVPPVSFPTVSGYICSFNSAVAGLPLKSHVVDVDYTGSDISGVHIQNTCGINQWDEVWENGTINSTTGENEPNSAYIRSKNYIRINPNTNYYYKTSATLRLVYYDANKNFVGIANANNLSVLSPANAYYVRFYPNTSSYGSTYKNDISINYPSTDTSYHAFEGQSFNITFSIPIYGGSYDCLTGIVTSDKDSGGGDITPTYQQTATANCETSLGVNNIWSDTGDTTLQYIKIGGNT